MRFNINELEMQERHKLNENWVDDTDIGQSDNRNNSQKRLRGGRNISGRSTAQEREKDYNKQDTPYNQLRIMRFTKKYMDDNKTSFNQEELKSKIKSIIQQYPDISYSEIKKRIYRYESIK